MSDPCFGHPAFTPEVPPGETNLFPEIGPELGQFFRGYPVGVATRWSDVESLSAAPATLKREGDLLLVTSTQTLYRWSETLGWMIREAVVPTEEDLPGAGPPSIVDGAFALVSNTDTWYIWSSIAEEWSSLGSGAVVNRHDLAFAPKTVLEEEEVVVPEDTQYLVYGALSVDGELDLTAPGAELIILVPTPPPPPPDASEVSYDPLPGGPAGDEENVQDALQVVELNFGTLQGRVDVLEADLVNDIRPQLLFLRGAGSVVRAVDAGTIGHPQQEEFSALPRTYIVDPAEENDVVMTFGSLPEDGSVAVINAAGHAATLRFSDTPHDSGDVITSTGSFPLGSGNVDLLIPAYGSVTVLAKPLAGDMQFFVIGPVVAAS